MTPGSKIVCPHCGENTVVKQKPKMRGWTRVGDVLVCALCGAEIGPPEAETKDQIADSASRKLAALLGETKEPVVRLDPGSEHRRFCRNCRNRIEHPFLLRCGRSGSEIDPGGCCKNFEPEELKQ